MENELYHYGVLGMKWGVRRFQNSDGSLAPAGKRAVRISRREAIRDSKKKKNKSVADEVPEKKKSVHDMSDDELNSAIRRLELERRYNDLTPKQVSVGKKLVDDVVLPAATNVGKQVFTDFLTKQGKKALGLDAQTEDALDALKKEAATLSNEKLIKILKAEKAAGKW